MERRVSVIIPSYNTAPWIGAALDSVFAQTQAAHEVIVVDDGSSDDSLRVLERYGRGVRLISQRHAGIGAARNRGARAASGDDLLFLDGDDVLEPQAIERQIAVSSRCPEAGFVAGEGVMFADDRVLTRSLQQIVAPGIDPHGTSDGIACGRCHLDILAQNPVVSVGQVLIPRAVFGRVGGFAERNWFAEDWDLWLRISRHHPVAFHTGPVLRYRHRPTAFSGIEDERFIRWAIWRVPVLVDHLRASSPPVREAFAERLERNVRDGSLEAYYYGRRGPRWRAAKYLARLWWKAPWLPWPLVRLVALALPERLLARSVAAMRKLRDRAPGRATR
jgi:glycosyltransferase involved in cell wall biosynthesis